MNIKVNQTFSIRTNQGFTMLTIIGFLGVLITSGLALYTYSLKSRYADLAIKDDLAEGILTNGIMDYVVHSVKSKWCIGSYWTEDKAACLRNDFKHDGSIRRLLASNSELITIGENLIVQQQKGRLVADDFAQFKSCGQDLLNKIPQNQIDFQIWTSNWIKCLSLNEITGEISLNLDRIPSNHPVRSLVEVNSAKYKTLGFQKAVINLRKSNKVETPNYGREVNLELTVSIIRNNLSPIVVRSLMSATPVELNRYSLLVAGDLHLESSQIPAELKKGLYIANSLSLPSSETSHPPVGVHFESPVFINQRIILPNKSEIEKVDYQSLHKEIRPNVIFADNLYLGYDFAKKSDKTIGSNVSSLLDTSNCTSSTGAGSVCQDGDIFKSNENNKLIHSKLFLRNSISLQGYDGGLDYIAGPNLSGQKDNDTSTGRIIKACSNLNASQSDLNITMGNQLKYLNIGISENLFFWDNTSNTSSSNFSLRNSNRFQSPKSDIPRGAHSKCYIDRDNDETIIKPQIYGARSKVKVKENGTNIFKDVFQVTYKQGFDINNVVGIPTPELFNDQGSELGKCPKNRKISQFDALKGDFSDKAKVILNLEYYLEAGDRLQTINQIRNNYLPILRIEDALDSVFPSSGYGFEDLTDKISSSIEVFLNVDNKGLARTTEEIFGACNSGIKGHQVNNKAVIYCTKALLGLNSNLKRSGNSLLVREQIIQYIKIWKEMMNFRIGAICQDKSTGSSANCLYGDTNDDSKKLRTIKKSIRYQIGELLVSMTSKYKTNTFTSADDGHYKKNVDEAITLINEKYNQVLNELNTAQSELATASSKSCPQICTGGGIDINGVAIPQTCSPDAACEASKVAAQTLAQTKIDQINSVSGGDFVRLNSDYDKLSAIANLESRSNALVSIGNELDAIQEDLIDVIGDVEVAMPTGEQELKFNIGTSDTEVLKSAYDPRAFILKGGIPKSNNRFVFFYKIKLNAFDPSYSYSEVSLKDKCSNANDCEIKCLEGEKTEPVIRAYIIGSSFSKNKCLEFISTRQVYQDDGKGNTIALFTGGFDNTVSVSVDPTSNSDTNKYIVTGGTASITRYKELQEAAKIEHMGFYEFACNMVSAFKGKSDDEDQTEEAVKLAINGGFNDPAKPSLSFLDQTNHSWYFAPINPYNHFLDIEDESYDVDPSHTDNTQNIEISSDSIPDFKDESENNSTIEDIETSQLFSEDAFQVQSIAANCTIKKNVKIYTGFLVCRHLIIENGRTEPLQIIGTVIAGRVTIPSDAVQYGVYFKSIFHPDAKRNLLKSVADCNKAIDANPVWFRPEMNIDDIGRLAKLAALDECSVINLRNKAQPFSWSKVDPDCGLVGKFTAAKSRGPNYSERMMCKDNVENYFITERWRSTP